MLALAAEPFFQMYFFLCFINAVDRVGPLREPEQRRAGQVEVPVSIIGRICVKEERHQQRGNMGAVHVRIGHDDDLVIAQIIDVEFGAQARRQALGSGRISAFDPSLGGRRPQHVEDFPAQRQQGLGLAIPRHFGRPPAESPSTMNKLCAFAGCWSNPSACPAGAASVCCFARGLFFLTPAQPFFGAQHQEIEDRACGFGIRRQPVVKVVAHGVFHHAVRFGCGKAVFGLAHKFRLADEAATPSAQPPVIRSSRVIEAAFLLFDQLAVGADALEDRGPEPRLVGAAFGRGDRVAIALDEAVACGRPVDRPLDFAGG